MNPSDGTLWNVNPFLFNLLKWKQALDRLFQPIDAVSWLCYRLSVCGGLSSVITPAGNQHPAELKDPWLHERCGPSQAALRSNSMPPTETPAPACCSPPSRCWLKCSRLLALRSGTGGRGAFWIIIMLLRCHLQHKTGSLAIPQTCESSFTLWLKLNFLTVMIVFSHFSQSTKKRPEGTFGLCQKARPDTYKTTFWRLLSASKFVIKHASNLFLTWHEGQLD